MYEMDYVLVEGIVTTRHKSLGAARLPSPATPALVVGYHGPVAANSSIGPTAFVVDSDLAAEILKITVVFNITVTAIHQIQHVVFRVLIAGVDFRDQIQHNIARTSKAQCVGGLLLQLPPCLGCQYRNTC